MCFCQLECVRFGSRVVILIQDAQAVVAQLLYGTLHTRQRMRGFFFVFLLVYRIPGSKTKNTVYSSFLSLTVEKTISYYYLLSLLVPIISYYSFFWGAFINRRW